MKVKELRETLAKFADSADVLILAHPQHDPMHDSLELGTIIEMNVHNGGDVEYNVVLVPEET